MVLMGLNLDYLDVESHFSNRDPWILRIQLFFHWAFMYFSVNKELHHMAGNGIAMRSLYACLCALLTAVDPIAAQKYLAFD